MPRTIQGSSISASVTLALGTTYYSSLSMSNFSAVSTTETRNRLTSDKAGTFTYLAIRIGTNTLSTANITVTFRKNGGNEALTFVVAPGQTGTFSDSSHSVTIAPTDTFNVSITVDAGGTGSATMSSVSSNFAATSSHSVFYGSVSPGGITYSVASTTNFIEFMNGGTTVGTAENDIKTKATVAGTLSGLQIQVGTNARSTATTYRSRINNANGAQSVSITALTTGVFQDTTNTDSVAAGDFFNASITTGTGTGNLIGHVFAATFTSTTNKNNLYTQFASGQNRAASATPDYYAIYGTILTSTTETARSLAFNYPTSLTNLMVYLTANTYSVDATATIRKNAGDATNVVTLTAATTGLFEDTTHTDTFASSDLAAYKIVGGTTGSITATWFGCLQAPTITPKSMTIMSS